LSVRTTVEVCAASANRGIGQAAREPQDKQCLRPREQAAAEAVDAAEGAPANALSQPGSDRRADGFADDHGTEQADEDEVRPDRRVDVRQRLLEEGHREDRDAATDQGADEPADLRQGARAVSQQHRDDDEQHRERVEQVHRRIVAQAP
jgi:hypothetical protein